MNLGEHSVLTYSYWNALLDNMDGENLPQKVLAEKKNDLHLTFLDIWR